MTFVPSAHEVHSPARVHRRFPMPAYIFHKPRHLGEHTSSPPANPALGPTHFFKWCCGSMDRIRVLGAHDEGSLGFGTCPMSDRQQLFWGCTYSNYDAMRYYPALSSAIQYAVVFLMLAKTRQRLVWNPRTVTRPPIAYSDQSSEHEGWEGVTVTRGAVTSVIGDCNDLLSSAFMSFSHLALPACSAIPRLRDIAKIPSTRDV
ncbi:hypothetical protein C8R45DRAFT_927134 [Mycena sanguinolenta]|nr:hypothetical protein C8R45DRAFT_927134 [Mycena sanguinolenta]